MAKLHFITILLLCHTLLRVNGQSTSSSITVSPTSTSTPSLTTSSSAQGQSSVSSSSSTSMPMSAVSISQTSTYTIAPSPSTSPPADGQSNSRILLSNYTVPPTSTSTAAMAPAAKGAQVNITIYVWVSTCSGASYENASSPEYRGLERNLKGNLTVFYTRDGVSFMLSATLQTAQCTGNYVKVVVTITFKLGITFTIEVDIKVKISGNFLGSLRVDGARVEVAFIGVKITFKIKIGECKRVCCDGAGGPVNMVSSCNPQDGNNNSCEGFKSEEKQEDDHCPGEADDLCSSTCDSSEENQAGSVQCPSIVLLGILAVATFLK